MSNCPKCGVSLQGEPIPAEDIEAGYYGAATHFGREIARYDVSTDRTVSYQCPDCGYAWSAEAAEKPTN